MRKKLKLVGLASLIALLGISAVIAVTNNPGRAVSAYQTYTYIGTTSPGFTTPGSFWLSNNTLRVYTGNFTNEQWSSVLTPITASGVTTNSLRFSVPGGGTNAIIVTNGVIQGTVVIP